MSPEESDMLFLNSVRLIEYDNLTRKSTFAQHLMWHVTAKTQLDALIYVLSELRRRTTGELVATAWEQVEIVFEDFPGLVEDNKNTLYLAIGDLTLQAWEARSVTLARQLTDKERPIEPTFVSKLLAMRQSQPQSNPAGTSHGTSDDRAIPDVSASQISMNSAFAEGQTADSPGFPINNNISMQVDNLMDWTYWEDLLHVQGPDGFPQPFFDENY